MTSIKIQEVANPAAVGFRWFGEDGTEHEITWLRGVEDGGTWWIGTKIDGRWSNTTAPGIPRAKTLKEAREIANNFIGFTVE